MEQEEARISRLLTEGLKWGPSTEPSCPIILDNHWSMELDPRVIVKLLDLYPGNPDIMVGIAGKEEEPDTASFALAVRVLTNLRKYVDYRWNWYAEVIFPYQKNGAISLWYAEYESIYSGNDLYAFRGSGVVFTQSCVHCGSDNYADVPHIILQVLRNLRKSGAADPELAQVSERIEKEKLFGTELILPLMKILGRNGWKNSLEAIAKYAD